MTYCLDSWAILAWLDGDEPAASEVETVLNNERPRVSWINLVEVEYRIWRDHGQAEAASTLAQIRSLIDEELAGIERMRGVAALKATYPIALADCFAIAIAAGVGATLLTGDPEILERAATLPCEVQDART